MPEQVRLYPECHADTALIYFLVSDITIIQHAAGINEVSKALETSHSDSVTLIGVIDNDKHKPRYIKQFMLVREENKVCLLHKPESRQYIIIIDKAIETFLLWNADQVGLSVIAYGFESEVKKLGLQLKRRSIETEPLYQNLLSDLLAAQAPGFMALERILHELIA